MIEIQCDSKYSKYNLDTLLKSAAAMTLDHHGGHSGASLTVVLTDDERLRSFNKKYRGLDEVTDVLSFPAADDSVQEDSDYLGDILISYQRAAAQAEDDGHTVEQELELLTVHAALHLIGYDHAKEDDKAAMWTVQEEILAKLGNPLKP